MGTENLVLFEGAELAKPLRNKKENYIKNHFLLSRIASKKIVERMREVGIKEDVIQKVLCK